MSHSRSLALIVAAALTAALAPAALASAAAPAKTDDAKAEHDRIVEYWTPERMKAAKPRDFVRQKDGSFTLAPTPNPYVDASTTIAGSTGLPWNGEGEVLARTGKVYFTLGTRGYVCSGAVAEGPGSTTKAVVLTAAHCVYDQAKYSAKRPNAGFATNWLFIPGFDSNPILNTSNCSVGGKYGCWTAEALVVHKGFASQRSFTSMATTYDFAFAVVGAGGSSSSDLEVAVGGGYKIDTNVDGYPAVESTLSAFGYPAADPYKGLDLTYCSGAIGTDSNNGNKTWSMPCNMTGGSSGGPWLAGVDVFGNDGVLSSLNSYGYAGIANMYGPKFNGETKKLYDHANGATPVTKVIS